MRIPPSTARLLAAGLVAAAVALAARPTLARESVFGTVSVTSLPAEARTTLSRIEAGGPYPYPRDGVVFNNREHLLPRKPYGYYHEYTVPTPYERTRGARRIVCGGTSAARPQCYYSDDHYRSFQRIVP
ncbi:MAG TPA: ribonuclease domain-containing protein [Casimicrobiaceae bacterium]|nr:ribonuclease domain-containing protein [Casimicrobiaceae bacterium]